MDQNKRLAWSIAMVVLGMICFAYASVPLYNLFCRVTGYGGTTRVDDGASHKIGSRIITVRFDANVNPDLPLEFKTKQKEVSVKVGENNLVFYTAKNIASKPIIGTAIYNVSPHKAAIYFNKIQCFCFEEQLFEPNQEVILPVSFFIDSAFEDDREMDDVKTITLSYSFFRVRE